MVSQYWFNSYISAYMCIYIFTSNAKLLFMFLNYLNFLFCELFGIVPFHFYWAVFFFLTTVLIKVTAGKKIIQHTG